MFASALFGFWYNRSTFSAVTQSVTSAQAGSGSSTATVTFNTDGTTSGTATGTANRWISVSNWYTSPGTGVGAGFYININSGGWNQLSVARSDTLTGTNNSSTHTYSIATDAGGTNVVGGGTIYLEVDNGL